MANFADEVAKQIEGLISEAEMTASELFRKVVRNAYDEVINNSPIWSGYYKSNHRITVRNSKGQFKVGGVKLFPTQKPDFAEIFTYIGNIETARSTELAKLSKLEIGDSAQITTLVPYADEVELKHRVYANTEAIIRASR